MTDNEHIRRVIIKSASYAFHDGIADEHDEEDVAVSVVNALHAAGYEIVPTWSADLDSAPRYTAILIWDHDEAFVGYKNDHDLFGTQTEVLPEATHWKPITPPKESGE